MRSYLCRNIQIFCLLAFLQVSLFPLTSRAATFYVPADYPTIQEAINIAGSGDEIIVSPGIYYENISIGGKDIILRSTDPNDPAVVANTIIDGGGNGSVVTFLGLESGDCVLAGFTITNGYAPSGGGINGNFTFASIKYNNIIGNVAYGSWPEGFGGGLYKCRGYIQNNIISWNSATYGGGLSDCNGHIYNNVISQNSAVLYGGGLYNCDVSIVNNTISNNSANSGGGLYYCDGAIQNNTIIGNYAEQGGGLAECHTTIMSNIISANVASYYGGGIRHCDGGILNNIIYKNSALSGGGLHYCNGDIKNNTIWGNVATSHGGGLMSCFWANIQNCIIYNNRAYTGSDQIGGSSTPSYCCIQDWNGEGTGNISANPRLLNPAYGDFHLREDSPCIDAGCYVPEVICDFEYDVRGFNGSSEPRGDGSDYDIGADEFTHIIIPTPTPTPSPACVIYVPGEKPTIQSAIDAAVDGCEIIVAPGIYFENINLSGKNITLRSTEPTNPAVVASTIINGREAGPVVTFTGRESVDCVLSGFTITNGLAEYGGGIKGNGCLATIKNNIICENIAEKDGGGIFHCNGLIQNNIIRGNRANSSGGGIIFCNGPVLNNTLSSNSATWYGGGMYICAGTIQNNIISGNNATFGGGVSNCHGTIQNNIITGNMASSGGGLYYCGGFIQNNTIWNNVAFNQGGGLSECSAIIANCVIYRNQASAGGDQLWISAIPSYSCIQDWNEGGTGNISADPKLRNPEAGNFHLAADSPCIDAGCYIEGLTQDFEGDLRGYDGSGEPRGDGSDYDIGADEYVGIVPTPTETPTPTPEPTLTPSPTPTPALPHFTFEEGEEGWTFSGKIPPFDEAAGNWEIGHLTLNALGSTNCFGYWFSPDVAVEGGKLYRARWTVGSDATEPDNTVGFRLRINQRGSWAGWDRVVNSYLGQAPSAGNPKTYNLYFDPVVTGVNDDHLVIFSFDLTSFEISDNANSWLYLEELVVEDLATFLRTK